MFTQKPLHYHEIAIDASAAAVLPPHRRRCPLHRSTGLRGGGVTMGGKCPRATTGPGGCDVCGDGGGRSNRRRRGDDAALEAEKTEIKTGVEDFRRGTNAGETFRTGDQPESFAWLMAHIMWLKLHRRRNPEGYDIPSDLDRALLLYFDGQEQDKPSTQEEPHKPLHFVKETLSIFPSQPMDGVPTPTPKASTSAPPITGSSWRSPAPAAAEGRPLAVGKTSKATVKREESGGGAAASASSELEGPKIPDPKTLRRLAQNREAARKSRLRKKAYIQQLETGRIRLAHLEQEIQLTRAQGALWGAGILSPDAALFNLEYERWQEAHHQVISQLRAAVEEHRQDAELQHHVDAAVSHYGVLMAHKARLVGADPLHLLSGLWKGTVEQCFLWIGDFRPSQLIKVVVRHVEPLTEQQLAAVYSAQQAARREEDALDGALQALLRSLSDVVSSSDAPESSSSSQQTPPVMYHNHHPAAAAAMATASFMGQYGSYNNLQLAMDKLASLATFLRQADEVRLRTLHALRRMLTVRQAARWFVAVDDYFGRLRALALFWTTTRQPAAG